MRLTVSSSVSSYVPTKPYRSVLFDTWHDSGRIPDIVGGSTTCRHLLVDNDRCSSCGAYVGFIGNEKSASDFYQHVYMLASFIYPDSDMVVLSDRLVPHDYTLEVLGSRVSPKHYRSSWYLVRDDRFANVFSMSPPPRKNLNLWKGFLFDFILTKTGSPLLVLNPKKEYASFGGDCVVANKVFDAKEWMV